MLSEDGLRRINMKENTEPTIKWFIDEINASEWLPNEDKTTWIDLLPIMNEKNILEFYKILITEKDYNKLIKFHEKHFCNYKENHFIKIYSYRYLLEYCMIKNTRVIKRKWNICELRNGEKVEVTFDKEYFNN